MTASRYAEPVRRAVRLLFDSHPRFEVCGEAEHGREAVEKALSFRPDLIVLDRRCRL
jgi:chemotaxis response regulator CheB